MLTPSSTSSPLPVVMSASMTAASAGLLATRTRSLARSYHRNAGIPSMTPCRMPIWLAGVVAGSLGVHSCSRCVPDLTHRVSVGTVPAVIAICSTGKGTPSICTNTTPSTSGSASLAGRRRAEATRRLTSTCSVPALPNHPSTVLTRPTTTATRNAVQKPSTVTLGRRAPVSRTTAACPTKVRRKTPSQPSRTAAHTSTGCSTTPTRAKHGGEGDRTPGLVHVEAGQDPVAQPHRGHDHQHGHGEGDHVRVPRPPHRLTGQRPGDLRGRGLAGTRLRLLARDGGALVGGHGTMAQHPGPTHITQPV